MKLQVCALAGVALIYSLEAQTTGGSGTTDPVIAAQEAQQQAQMAYQNQLSDINTAANQAKEGLLSRRNTLNRELQNCFIQKNEAEIQANQTAEQAKQQAMNQLIQGATQGLTPLLQNMGTANNLGKEEAASNKKAKLAAQKQASTVFATACGSTVDTRIDDQGKRASQIKVAAQTAQAAEGASPHAITGCRNAAAALLSTTADAEDAIKEEKQVKTAASGNTANIAMAVLATGANVYGYSQATKGAESGLEDSKRINGLNYDSCQQGIQDEAAELDRQLANIDRQLATDKARLAQQFAQFKLNVPANIQSKDLLNVDEGDNMPVLGGVGGAVAGTQFKGPENPFGNLGKGGGGGGSGAGGAAGSGAGGGGDGSPAGWGFTNPYETNNPGALYTLPTQPDKAGLIGGADGDGGGGGANPFGDGFMGFEDPFGNLAGAGGAALAGGEGGNGFIELALKTRRRVYAHLGELLGQPSGSKVSNKDEKKPAERKISSIRD